VGEKGQQQVRRGQPKRGRVGEGRPMWLQKGKGRGRPEAICMRLLATAINVGGYRDVRAYDVL